MRLGEAPKSSSLRLELVGRSWNHVPVVTEGCQQGQGQGGH